MNITAAMASSAVAFARPPAPTGEQIVNALDLDKDGGISATEIEKSELSSKLGELFDKIDGDSDGLLSTEELDAFGQAKNSEGPKGGGEGPPRGGPPPPPPPSEADAESLLLSLFEISEETETESLTAFNLAQAGYSQTQEMFSNAV